MTVWCLDVHSGWRCRHSGACCGADWAIPIEAPTLERLFVPFGDRWRDEQLFITGGPLPEGTGAIVGRRDSGACVFLRDDAVQRCEIHRTLGPELLPVACRQFPRIVLQDARGTFLTLSHFCPTAAALLLKPSNLSIVAASGSLALHGEVEGLDARNALPPLLRPGLLTDLEGYDAWERRAIETLGTRAENAALAIGVIHSATLAIERWKPGGESLREAVDDAFDQPYGDPLDSERRDEQGFMIAVQSVPQGLRAPSIPALDATVLTTARHICQDFDRPVRAWLAARLFGNWIGYSGSGLRAIVAALNVCLSVLIVELARTVREAPQLEGEDRFVEAVRQADLLIVHLADVGRLSRLLSVRLS